MDNFLLIIKIIKKMANPQIKQTKIFVNGVKKDLNDLFVRLDSRETGKLGKS